LELVAAIVEHHHVLVDYLAVHLGGGVGDYHLGSLRVHDVENLEFLTLDL
jgi:hypothetical protein